MPLPILLRIFDADGLLCVTTYMTDGLGKADNDPCKETKFNMGTALAAGLGSSIGGVFGPVAGEALGGVFGATVAGAQADISINAAASVLYPTQYKSKSTSGKCECK